MNAPAIAVENIAAGKGAVEVFSGLSFEIAPSSFTAMVGANGSGKTTLFEALLGLVKLRTGRVEILGKTPRAVRSQVAYVPQASRLLHDGSSAVRNLLRRRITASAGG